MRALLLPPYIYLLNTHPNSVTVHKSQLQRPPTSFQSRGSTLAWSNSTIRFVVHLSTWSIHLHPLSCHHPPRHSLTYRQADKTRPTFFAFPTLRVYKRSTSNYLVSCHRQASSHQSNQAPGWSTRPARGLWKRSINSKFYTTEQVSAMTSRQPFTLKKNPCADHHHTQLTTWTANNFISK